MKKFLKDLVEMLAISAYSEIGDREFDLQGNDVKSAPAPAQRACQAPVRA